MRPVAKGSSPLCMLIVVALMVGRASAAGAENLRRIVLFNSGTSLQQQLSAVLLSKSTWIHTLSLINGMAIELWPVDPLFSLTSLSGSGIVSEVHPDPIGGPDPEPSASTQQSPSESYGWGEEWINVPSAHEFMQNMSWSPGSGVTIAILDSGVYSHPDLQQNIAGGYNALRGGSTLSYNDNYGHGTQMAGIIAARADEPGIIGVAPYASIKAVKVIDDSGVVYVSDVIEGLQWADNHGIRLINMSLGFIEASKPLEQATRTLYNRGAIIVASAGNKSCPPGQNEGGGSEGESECNASQLTDVKYPARYCWVIAVTAIDSNGQVPDYCLLGPEVDVKAPGGSMLTEQILSTDLNGGYTLGSGTSHAAAHVTGSIALALQVYPSLTFTDVYNYLRGTAECPEETEQEVRVVDVYDLLLQALE
jgi:subtilisin family serine protease